MGPGSPYTGCYWMFVCSRVPMGVYVWWSTCVLGACARCGRTRGSVCVCVWRVDPQEADVNGPSDDTKGTFVTVVPPKRLGPHVEVAFRVGPRVRRSPVPDLSLLCGSPPESTLPLSGTLRVTPVPSSEGGLRDVDPTRWGRSRTLPSFTSGGTGTDGSSRHGCPS